MHENREVLVLVEVENKDAVFPSYVLVEVEVGNRDDGSPLYVLVYWSRL